MEREGLTSLSDEPSGAEPASLSMQIPTELSAWLTTFQPHPWLMNGHLQTIVGNFLPRPAFRLPTDAETVEVDPTDGSRVLCHCHWQPEAVRAARLTAVLVHGLEGSSDSRYMKGIAARAWDAGMNVVRMNMRNCGGTDALTPTLYHSGRSADVGAVVHHLLMRFGLERIALVGYSMGGNLVLKLAGEWGARAPLVAVATVCPAIDLAPGADALHQPANRMYEWNFLRGLMRRVQHKRRSFQGSTRFMASARCAPSASSTTKSSRRIAASATPTTTTTAPPAPALSIASPFPADSRAQDDPFIRLSLRRARSCGQPVYHLC